VAAGNDREIDICLEIPPDSTVAIRTFQVLFLGKLATSRHIGINAERQ
jgi:hypothetical protein